MSLSVDIEKKLKDYTLRVKFEAGDGVLALLGASGCGKSMTLKCIAGIERPDRGHIELGGRVLFDSESRINLSPQKRRVGYLFQEFALFPNMTVAENIACAVPDRSRRDEVTKSMITAMRLDGLEKRKPCELSGGEKQRTALARILANSPEALLLDEPLSSLDTHLRFSLEAELSDVTARLEKPVILVSHERGEAFRLSSHIALMDRGIVQTAGEKNAVFSRPKTCNCARVTGCENIYPAEKAGEGCVAVKPLNTQFKVTEPFFTDKGVDMTHIGIRTSDIMIVGPGESMPCNELCCTVSRVVENPQSFTLCLMAEGADEEIKVEVRKGVYALLPEKPKIYIPPEAVMPLADR